jgi:hypothetical protein
MIRFALLTIFVAASGGVARAACVELAGEPALVEAIGRELGTRGIAVEACPSLRATVAWRGAELVVVVDDGRSTERTVGEVATAATVIESFARGDVALPLLATRAVPAPPHREPPVEPPRPSLQLAANVESSFANDGTTWLGASAKICVRLGPLCAAARFRTMEVVEGLGGVERGLNELLIGVDVPIALGRWRLAPGFAGGLGGMETRVGGMKRETGGFRAETHVSLAIPIANQLAIDLSLGAGFGDFDRSLVMAPLEPSVELRGGIGLRYGR